MTQPEMTMAHPAAALFAFLGSQLRIIEAKRRTQVSDGTCAAKPRGMPRATVFRRLTRVSIGHGSIGRNDCVRFVGIGSPDARGWRHLFQP
jgi:hypothetical protein